MANDFLHAVVTGGTGALGIGVVGLLVRNGWRVTIPLYKEDELDGFPLREESRVGTAVAGDLADEAQAVRFFREEVSGPVHASIHLAGGFAMASLEKTSAAELERMLRMNAVSAYLCCREAARRLRENDPDERGVRGRIVNVAAGPGVAPERGAGVSAYTISKAAVAAMTQALAAELRPDGIWVNAVAPSIIDTPANRAAMPEADHARWATPEDLARTIAYLASPENAVVTGGLVPVGGHT